MLVVDQKMNDVEREKTGRKKMVKPDVYHVVLFMLLIIWLASVGDIAVTNQFVTK